MIPVCEPLLDGNEKKYVDDCLNSGWISSAGKYVTEFEEKFAKYCGCKYGVTTTSGTTALHLALAALGIGPGDEVIVPTFTIAACAFAVLYTGATPVFVDCDPVTYNIDPEKMQEAITDRTRAIMPVHIYGHMAEMDKIMEIVKDKNIFVWRMQQRHTDRKLMADEPGVLVMWDASRFMGTSVSRPEKVGCWSRMTA